MNKPTLSVRIKLLNQFSSVKVKINVSIKLLNTLLSILKILYYSTLTSIKIIRQVSAGLLCIDGIFLQTSYLLIA